ncbi:MAG: transcription factor YdeB [Epulopiscium sp.]|nr:transcription factor YdeB [Candidatus Epulonipiscium sp.]
MLKVGSKVVYPMQGIGVVSSIEEKNFYDETKRYYTIDILNSTMNILIPADKIPKSNLRLVSDLSTLEKILSAINKELSPESEELSQKEKYALNMKKIKSGSLKESIELVRDLTHAGNIKKLNSNETQILATAKKMVLEEISVIKDISTEEADDFLKSRIS